MVVIKIFYVQLKLFSNEVITTPSEYVMNICFFLARLLYKVLFFSEEF